MSRQNNAIIIVQGAQYGSEAKGMVAAALGLEREVDFAIRTGTVNAGHTVIYRGTAFKMQQLPVGWTNPRSALVIGPGAYIHPEVLARELQMVLDATGMDLRRRLFIDYRCGLHMPSHTDLARRAGRHYKMGATGKGCSEAVVDKIRNRGDGGVHLFADWLNAHTPRADPDFVGKNLLTDLNVLDTAVLLNQHWKGGAQLLIEGTQGTMLDLHLGPYPFVTHKQTQSGNWIAEAGLSPSLPYEIILVVRCLPIRVAGNSGPLPHEISWVDVCKDINLRLHRFRLPPRVQPETLVAFETACRRVADEYWSKGRLHFEGTAPKDLAGIEYWTPLDREMNPVYVSELHREALTLLSDTQVTDLRRVFEMTTVTGKIRRVAHLDVKTLQNSVILNQPSSIALTFVNHLFPEMWDLTEASQFRSAVGEDSIHDLVQFVARLQVDLSGWDTRVRYVSTGAATECLIPFNINGGPDWYR